MNAQAASDAPDDVAVPQPSFGVHFGGVLQSNPHLRNKLRNVVYYIHENCLILTDYIVQCFNAAKGIDQRTLNSHVYEEFFAHAHTGG